MAPYEAVSLDLDGTLCVPRESDAAFHGAVFDAAGVEQWWSPAELRAVGPEAIRRERRRDPDGSSAEGSAAEGSTADECDVQGSTADGSAPDEPGTDGMTGFFTALYRAVAREHASGPDPAAPILAELGERAGERYDPTAVRLREGAESVLATASERAAVGLVTNGHPEVQTAKLEALGVADAFDAVVCCHPETGLPPKPAVEPFDRLLAALETPAADAVHVGDSLAEDVAGARDAGLATVWTPTNRAHEQVPAAPDPAPTHRVDDLAAVSSLW